MLNMRPSRLYMFFVTVMTIYIVFVITFIYSEGISLHKLSYEKIEGNVNLLKSMFTLYKKPGHQKSDNKSNGKKLVSLFTSFIDSTRKKNVHRNVLLNWANISPRIQPIFFGNLTVDSELGHLARKLGWIVHPTERLYNGDGPPFVKDMYHSAAKLSNSLFYGFANGDILFTEDLVTTLDGMGEVFHNVAMVVGRRSNMDVNESSDVPLYTNEEIRQRAKTKFSGWAEDFFILQYPEKFPWHKMADVVIGTTAYDNYLSAIAVLNNVSVVDASKTLLAVHQSGSDGNFAGHRNKYSHASEHSIGVFDDFSIGIPEKVPYLTIKGSDEKILIKKRQVKAKTISNK